MPDLYLPSTSVRFLNRRWRTLALAALWALMAGHGGAALADTVWMKNGDRLTGTIKLLDAGKLTLSTEYGGTISLDWKQVQTLESSKELLIRDETLRQDYLARLQRADQGTVVVVAPGVAQQPVELASLAQVMKPRPFINDALWKGKLDLGLNYKTASTRTEDYSARLDTEARHGRWRHNLDAAYTRKTDNTITTSHNYGGYVSSDRFLTDQFFWQGRAIYKRDQIEDLSRQTAIGTGPGYQFWDNELGAFSLAGLIGRVRYDYSHGGSDNFYAASLRWDYKRYLSSQRFELYTNGELMRPLDNAADISLDASVGVRYRLTDWVSWFMSYSRNQVSGGRESLNEKRLTTGLGLVW